MLRYAGSKTIRPRNSVTIPLCRGMPNFVGKALRKWAMGCKVNSRLRVMIDLLWLHSSKVWVILHLIGNRGRGTVSRVDNGVDGQCEQTPLYGLNELGVIAVREVGASDRALEKGVSCDEDFAVSRVKTHASGRVTRGGDTLQLA